MTDKSHSVGRKHIGERTHGALWELAGTGEGGIGTQHCRNGHKETECGTTLATVECTALYNADGLDIKDARCVGYICSKSIEATHCRHYIIIDAVAHDGTGLNGQGRTDEQTVGLRL